jgi:hypothetical protein
MEETKITQWLLEGRVRQGNKFDCPIFLVYSSKGHHGISISDRFLKFFDQVDMKSENWCLD